MKKLSVKLQKLILWASVTVCALLFAVCAYALLKDNEDEKVKKTAKFIIIIELFALCLGFVLFFIALIIAMTQQGVLIYGSAGIVLEVFLLIKLIAFATLCILDLFNVPVAKLADLKIFDDKAEVKDASAGDPAPENENKLVADVKKEEAAEPAPAVIPQELEVPEETEESTAPAQENPVEEEKEAGELSDEELEKKYMEEILRERAMKKIAEMEAAKKTKSKSGKAAPKK